MSDTGLPKDTAAPMASTRRPEPEEGANWQSRLSRILARYGHLIRDLGTVVVFGVALWLLHREFEAVHLSAVEASFRALPWWSVALALLFTACNYAILIGYDWLAVHLIHHPLSFRQVTIASLLYYAFSNSLGPVFGGTPVRLRLYSSWGMSSQEIVRMIVFIAVAFWNGMFALSGVLFLATPFEIPARFDLPLGDSRPLGLILLLIPVLYFAACLFRKRPLHLFSVNFQPPPLWVAVSQTVVAAADLLCASAVLYVLLPNDVSIGFLSFSAVFLLAIIVALISHVPGGLGVLELVLIAMLPHSTHGLVASLLAYRVIYYLIPLTLALVSVSAVTVRQHSAKVVAYSNEGVRWTSMVSPRLITGAVFVAGLILLVSGALPAAEGRMELIRRLMPLPVIEVSHLLGSVIGALLLILAHALYRRIDTAWSITVVLLGLGVVVSLVKGFDYEEATILFVMLLAMLPCREHFYRRGRLLPPKLTLGWIVTNTIALGIILWVVLFAYRHVEYRDDLWWEFAYHGDAARSLRALVGAAVTIALVAVARSLQPRPIVPDLAGDDELEEVASIVAQSEVTNANLALLGDKRFIFSNDRKAVVMFGCEGNSWIAMGDPIGPGDSADDAAWDFREACDAAGVWPVFYQVDERTLGRYVEMGLSMLKLGEEARVPLETFSLDGRSRKDLRHTRNKAVDAGLCFEIVPQSSVPDIMPQLRQISDAWLGDKSTAEKGFSLGFFNERYLSRYDMALIRNAHDEPIAFANIWQGAHKEELSIDLMRYGPDSPHGVMEYLFIELMLYGREQGYAWFNLGMAPLSGVESHRLGPFWNRVSNLVFRHGEHFYNFQGLRNYKEKFEPKWAPKYLASPGGLATPQILTNVSTLISGGIGKLLHH